MRFLIPMVLAMALVGCGGSKPKHEYKIGCATFVSEVPLDTEALQRNLDNAQAILADAGVMTVEESCALLERWPVTVRDEYQWNCDERAEDVCADGHFSVLSGFTINNWGESLLHELLHAHEATQLSLTTTHHHGWEKRGWNTLNSFYRMLAQRVTTPEA